MPLSCAWRIKRVIPESPAQKAGVRPDDVITHFNNTEITAEKSPPQRIAIMAGIQVWCSISQPAP